jgi:nitrous oxidase accessory protein NosD
MRFASKAGLVSVAAIVGVGLGGVPAQASTHHRTIWVHPGTGTISAAVATAQPGDTIRLGNGTYFDSVFIPITLTIRGAGSGKTVIKPPQTSNNPCNSPGGVEGLCAAGAFDAQGNPDTSKPVTGVDIEDLRVTGFSDSGVFGFNTKGLHVEDVRADHNGGYGIAAFVSTKSVFERNWTSYNVEAGLYRGDSPHAKSVIRDNRADHNGIGVFLRDSTDLTAEDNTVWANCVGIFALWTGGEAAGDIPAGDFRIVDNTANNNNMACPATDHPPLSGMGIGLAGVHDTVVAKNEVHGNHPTGPSLSSGGITIFSTAFIGGADPTNNTVRNNELSNNQPADIVWDGTGSGNTVKHNECDTTIPTNLGGCEH